MAEVASSVHPVNGSRVSSRRSRRTPVALLLTLGAAVLLSSACYPGSYPLDLFNEMHYQSSQRLQEPERRSPPPGAVPITGMAADRSWADVQSVQNPVARSAANTERARKLFAVNCAMCHGPNGRGANDDPKPAVGARFAALGYLHPVDFQSSRVRDRSDGEVWWLITHGIGNMPPFGSLVSDDDRWMLVHLIREVQGR
jgi:mono/diheme cytochrome c family protein